jgi:hypothetical protein
LVAIPIVEKSFDTEIVSFPEAGKNMPLQNPVPSGGFFIVEDICMPRVE